MSKLFWLSFCDTSLPRGFQFLGVVIVEAEDFTDAIKKCWKLGINPGGEIQGMEYHPPATVTVPIDKLLSKAELEKAGLI